MAEERHLSAGIITFLPLVMVCLLTTAYLESNHPKIMHFVPEVAIVIIIGVMAGVFLYLTVLGGKLALVFL